MKPICLRPFTKVSCNSICNDRLPNYLVSLLMHIFVQVHFSRSSNLGEAFQNPCETTCVHDLTDNSNLVILLEEIRLTTWDVKSLLRIYQLVQVEGRLLPVISRVITPVIWVKKNGYPVLRPFMEFIAFITIACAGAHLVVMWVPCFFLK